MTQNQDRVLATRGGVAAVGIVGSHLRGVARAVGPDATWPAATSTSDPGRRPILDWERPLLTRLGVRVRTLRQAAGMTQARLAASAGIAERSLRRIEYGERRTRRSTLRRLAQSIAEQHDGQHARELLADLLEAVGPALAPESSYAERIEARRVRRTTKAAKRFVTRHITTYSYVRGGVVESHVHQRRVTRYRVRERRYAVLRHDSGRRVRLRLSARADDSNP